MQCKLQQTIILVFKKTQQKSTHYILLYMQKKNLQLIDGITIEYVCKKLYKFIIGLQSSKLKIEKISKQ